MLELNSSHDRFSFYVLSNESGDIHILKLLIVLFPGNCFTDALSDESGGVEYWVYANEDRDEAAFFPNDEQSIETFLQQNKTALYTKFYQSIIGKALGKKRAETGVRIIIIKFVVFQLSL